MAPIFTSYPELTAPLNTIKTHGHLPRLEHHTMYEPERPGWHMRAACLGFIQQGKDWWFPTVGRPGTDDKTAKQICATCPVSAECLADAMQQGAYCVGIWGGTNAEDRRRLRTKGTKPAPIPAIRHGTTYRYDKHKCRCDLCKKAHSTAQARYKKRKRAA